MLLKLIETTGTLVQVGAENPLITTGLLIDGKLDVRVIVPLVEKAIVFVGSEEALTPAIAAYSPLALVPPVNEETVKVPPRRTGEMLNKAISKTAEVFLEIIKVKWRRGF